MEESIQEEEKTYSQPQILTPPPTQAEIISFVKYTRYASLASDRLVETLLQMTSKLEEEGILRSDRPSRLDRDKKLRALSTKIQKSDSEINEMMKLITNHPDAEKIIKSLFKDIKSVNINTETLNNNNPIETHSIQQQNINISNETENNQIQKEASQFSNNEIPNINQTYNEESIDKTSEDKAQFN